MKDTYLTVSSISRGIFKDRGSKFYGIAYPLNQEDDVKDFLEEAKKEFRDARHHCYAYMLGLEGEVYRVNDDGEPSSTAGRPILGQIRSFGITNVLIVVVRYFGGVLLGTGGLINAYRTAAADALNNANIVEKIIEKTVKVNFDYIAMNDVMKVVKDENLDQFNHNYAQDCTFEIKVRLKDFEQVKTKLELINTVNLKY